MGLSFSIHPDSEPDWDNFNHKEALDEGSIEAGWSDGQYEKQPSFDAKFLCRTDQLPDSMQDKGDLIGVYTPNEAKELAYKIKSEMSSGNDANRLLKLHEWLLYWADQNVRVKYS